MNKVTSLPLHEGAAVNKVISLPLQGGGSGRGCCSVRSQRGFTLVELLVGLALSSVVALVLAQTFLVGYQVLTAESRAIAGDQAISSASLSLTRDLSSGKTTSVLPLTLTPGSGALLVVYGSPPVTVTYAIDASANLIRTAGGASTVSSRGLQRLDLSAGLPLCYLNLSLTPSASGAAAQTLRVGERTLGCF
ncbi:MAG: prepilin-type N-terminal cleavage/methylation domain-containing protein [Chloroflexi bacterium]|nr:MAG: prepilin-type N-terminal cleavage/methylation domain-containing protein [Chloroflexota bacterium]